MILLIDLLVSFHGNLKLYISLYVHKKCCSLIVLDQNRKFSMPNPGVIRIIGKKSK